MIKKKIQKFREYLDYFERHYDNVQKAWALIQEKCAKKNPRFLYDDFVFHSIDTDVKNHDESKLSKHEFTQYRQYFFPCEGEERDKKAFNSAWEHHQNHNSHHWQNWANCPQKSTSPYSDIYVVTMVIDWVAMGFEFGNTAKEYYENNKSKIYLPKWAVEQIYEIFDCLYSA